MRATQRFGTCIGLSAALIMLSGCVQVPAEPVVTETVRTTVEETVPAEPEQTGEAEQPAETSEPDTESQLSASGDAESTCMRLIDNKVWWSSDDKFTWRQGNDVRPGSIKATLLDGIKSPGTVCELKRAGTELTSDWGFYELTAQDRMRLTDRLKAEPGHTAVEQDGRTIFKLPVDHASGEPMFSFVSVGETNMVFASDKVVWDRITDL